MRVGNTKVERLGTTVRVTVTTGRGYELAFDRTACNAYHAELEAHDIYEGLRQGRIEMQREVLDRLEDAGLPGSRRGRLARAIGQVRRMYGL